MKHPLHIFDFDGTLTSADTLLQFICHACGLRRMLWGFLLHAPLLVLMKLHLYDNGKTKQKIFAYFFRGMDIEHFNVLCQQFAYDSAGLWRPAAKKEIDRLLHQNTDIIIVSASIDNWVAPFFAPWQDLLAQRPQQLRIVGTQIEVINERLTGRFLTPNCYGEEKVRRATELLSMPRDAYDITAYGDSRGDRELLQWADHAHYRPFR